MNYKEAREWLEGARSMANSVPQEPVATWQERIARADAAMMEQAYWAHKANPEGLHSKIDRLQAENGALKEALAAMQSAVRMATLDLIFALDQLATTPIDAERTAGTLLKSKARLMYALSLPPNA